MAGDLFEEHQAILDAAEDFLLAIKQEPRISMTELSRHRVKISALIRQHRAVEEEFIFEPLAREGGLGKLPHLEPHMQALQREKMRYTEHVRKWTPRAIEQDWGGYVKAVEGLIESLRHIVRGEQSCIYQIVRSLSPGLLHSRGIAR